MKKHIGPSLTLSVTKGPSSGLSSEYPPQTKVNVGRLVNGNKLTIKDPGISSKHLCIQFDSGSGHWTITDLGSSNGTILNSRPIKDSTPYPIADGDVIKLGEETVIGFGIGGMVEEKGGRGMRKRVKFEESELGFGKELGEIGAAKDGVIEEVREGRNGKKVGRGRGRKKDRDVGIGEEEGSEEERELEVGVVEELGKDEKKAGRGRGKKNGDVEIGKEGVIEEKRELEVGVVEELGKNKKKAGRGRPRRNRDIDIGEEGVIEEERELEVGVVEESGKNEKKMGRGRPKKNENAEIGKESERLENLGENEVKDAGLRRVTRGSRRRGNDGVENGEGIGDAGTGRIPRGGRITRSSRIQGMSEIRGYDANMDVVVKGRSKGNDGGENGEGIGDAGTGRVTRGGRITRSSRVQEMSEIRGYDSNMDVVEKGRGKGLTKSQKRTGTTLVENCGLGEDMVEGGLVENSEVVDGRSRRNCTKVRKKLEVEVEVKAPESLENGQIREEEMSVKSHLQEGDCFEGGNNGEGDQVERMQDNGCGDGDEQIREEEMGVKSQLREGDCFAGESNGEDQVESMQENVCGDGSTNLKRTNLSVLGRLEKMTMGQWLDYIEEYLPKQIVAETEEMITEMRRKAEKFHDFMLQQKAAKGGGDIQ